MKSYRHRVSGFTLVEILIVVIILGILAAIVIPQFTSASSDARESSVASQLQTIRTQIELYKVQHNDDLPSIAGGAADGSDVTNWDQLVKKTDESGALGGAFGPYLQQPPKNPLNGLSNVVIGDGTGPATEDAGFIYDFGTDGDGTGKIWATAKDKQTIFAEGK